MKNYTIEKLVQKFNKLIEANKIKISQKEGKVVIKSPSNKEIKIGINPVPIDSTELS